MYFCGVKQIRRANVTSKMAKKKIYIERVLNSSSRNLIWSLISTPSGLERWMADEVTEKDGAFTFRWGETWAHHDIHTAYIINKVKENRMRFKWDTDDDPDSYVELGMMKSDLTGNYTLTITDFAYPDDVESMEDLWWEDLERMHRSTGL